MSLDYDIWKDTFKLQVDEYSRQTSFTSYIEVINKASPSFDYIWDGNLGFAPYSASPSQKPYNLMYILK